MSSAADRGPPDLTFHGRKVVGGVAEGPALVSPETISGWGGVQALTGTIIESRHPLRGVSFAQQVLVFPGAKGSSGWSSVFHTARLAGMAPLALLFDTMTTKAALGAVVMRVPAMTGFDVSPLELIRTGDHVRVDAEEGIVSVWRARTPRSP